MNLLLANRLSVQLMTEHGLIGQGWKFKYDNAKRRFGVCKYRCKTIGLSASLVELNPESEVRDTILHEIAHALVGHSHGHGAVWQRKAREIGCTGMRCYDSNVILSPESRYVAECSGCGKVHKRHKMTQRIRFGNASCASCSGGRYNPLFKLVWENNPKF